MTDRRKSLEQGARRLNQSAYRQMQRSEQVWYVLLLRSGHEFVVQRILHSFKAETYLPMCRKWRRVNRFKREKTKIAYPAIPGCIFVSFPSGVEPWFEIFTQIPSLWGVVGLGGNPMALTGHRVSEFVGRNRKRFDVADEQKFMRSNCEFQVGDRVQIVEGPFEGHIVDVRSIKGAKANVLINVFGILQPVGVPVDRLERAA